MKVEEKYVKLRTLLKKLNFFSYDHIKYKLLSTKFKNDDIHTIFVYIDDEHYIQIFQICVVYKTIANKNYYSNMEEEFIYFIKEEFKYELRKIKIKNLLN